MRNEKIKIICLVAILSAMSIALDKVAKVTITKEIKITFYALPLIISGILHGPMIGFITGLSTGVVIQLTSEWGISIASVFYALAPIVWGLTSGLVFKHTKKNKIVGYIITVAISSICANLINTFAFFMDSLLINDSYYTVSSILASWPMRILTMFITMIPYIIISSVVCDRLSKYLNIQNK